MDLINRVAPIEVDGDIAICDGTDDPRSGLGHPREYIQLKKRSNTPETCKYCGLRYIKSSKSKNSK